MDSISSEYGWTDDVILDLTFCRFRQILTAIAQRQYESKRNQDLQVSWQVRTLATYIAAGYMVDGENKALDQAQLISLDPVEREFLDKTAHLPQQKEPARGSFEKLTSMLAQKKS